MKKKRMIMKILKKKGVVEKRGEEETKSMPHAPVISRLMEVKRHKEKNVVKVSRCETGHLSHRQLHFICTVPIAKDIHAYNLF